MILLYSNYKKRKDIIIMKKRLISFMLLITVISCVGFNTDYFKNLLTLISQAAKEVIYEETESYDEETTDSAVDRLEQELEKLDVRNFFEDESETESGIKTVNGYDTKVNVGQQNKHIPGTNEYKNALNNGQTKSIMYGDANDIQNLLNDKAGTGDFIGANKERVNFGQVIGQYVDPDTGVGVETTIGIIHYGKKGAHIVPARPN